MCICGGMAVRGFVGGGVWGGGGWGGGGGVQADSLTCTAVSHSTEVLRLVCSSNPISPTTLPAPKKSMVQLCSCGEEVAGGKGGGSLGGGWGRLDGRGLSLLSVLPGLGWSEGESSTTVTWWWW